MAQRQTMGLGGLYNTDTVFKRKFRWMFFLEGVSASGVSALPPQKSARPNLSFKEISVEHITETIYFPGKPEWKPLELTLYDIKQSRNPVILWLNKLYNPRPGNQSQGGTYNPSGIDTSNIIDVFGVKQPSAKLSLYDGCGNEIEQWFYINVWPQTIEFGELDMSSGDVMYIDLTLRYDRAYHQDML